MSEIIKSISPTGKVEVLIANTSLTGSIETQHISGQPLFKPDEQIYVAISSILEVTDYRNNVSISIILKFLGSTPPPASISKIEDGQLLADTVEDHRTNFVVAIGYRQDEERQVALPSRLLTKTNESKDHDYNYFSTCLQVVSTGIDVSPVFMWLDQRTSDAVFCDVDFFVYAKILIEMMKNGKSLLDSQYKVYGAQDNAYRVVCQTPFQHNGYREDIPKYFVEGLLSEPQAMGMHMVSGNFDPHIWSYLAPNSNLTLKPSISGFDPAWTEWDLVRTMAEKSLLLTLK